MQNEDQIISQAISILAGRLQRGETFTNPAAPKQYLQLKLAEKEQEVFAALFLDNQHRLIEYREMFFGTIDGASVYPREVVKAALSVNAAAVIFAHTHPSGTTEPSQADERITARLCDALELVEIRVLDHIVVSLEGATSFAERGLI